LCTAGAMGHIRVARTLCRIFADALGVDPQVFASVTRLSIDVLRMNHYALPPGVAIGQGTLTGMGAHTDYGIVTVLWADAVPGLQVLGGDGVWYDVQPAEGALLVNLDDLTACWTHERWRSTLHPVRAPGSSSTRCPASARTTRSASMAASARRKCRSR